VGTVVLTVAKVTGTEAGGYADYLQGKTTATVAGDYYLKDGERVEAPGRWVSGAHAVGVDPNGRVTPEQLRALMDVRRPDTGLPLRPVGSTGEAVAALDATFSAPKTISAIWALADPELRARVEAAHETAIDRALAYATAQVPMVRERIDAETVIHVKAQEMIASSWRHTTARAVDGQPPDPQLHSHVLLHGAVRRDGQVAAIDSRQWFTYRRELGAAYRTELARELTGLGFQIDRGTGRDRRYFEITGIPTQLTDRWSSRHHQVRDAIQARLQQRHTELQTQVDAGGPDAAAARDRLADWDADGQLSAREDRFLTHATRGGKHPETLTDLDHHWTEAAQELGVTRDHVDQILANDRREVEDLDPERMLTALTEHDATLTRSHARAIAMEQSAGVPIHRALVQLARMRDLGELLTLTDGTLTTREHRHREHQTVAMTDRLAGGDADPIPQPLVTRHAAQLDQHLRERGGMLSKEQREAFTLACGDRQLVVIEGQAGTGKSTVLTGVALAHRDAGQRVIVTSTAALAAQRLADDLTIAGVDPSTHSTVALHHAIIDGRVVLDPATTIIHDEAALASTRELSQLLHSVEESGARLILVGDPRQSHAVGAGGLWPDIEVAAHAHEAHVQLTHNLRAHDPNDVRDQHHFRTGEHEIALAGYDARERMHLHDTQPAAEDAALDAAHDDQRAGRRTLVIAQTSNDHLDELNARAQAIRQQDHQLGVDSLPLTGRPYELHAGDEIQLRASIPHPDRGTLRNGTTATITSLDPGDETAALALNDGREVTLTRAELNQAQARLAYVQHPFPAQGTTTDTTHLIIAEHPTQEGTYVALTRARDQTHLYAATDQLDSEYPLVPQLAERVSATDPDVPSIALPLAHERVIQADVRQANQTERPRDNWPGEPSPSATRPDMQHNTSLGSPDGDDRGPARATPERPPAVDAYRTKYAIADEDLRPLGGPPPASAFRQRLDRRHAAQSALNTLTPTDGRDMDTLARQLHEATDTHAARDEQTLDRDK
jgi:conjugative relaxase-like TrwC/TraI family protein